MLNANDWEKLSDDDFAAQRALCEAEFDRRECAKLAPDVAKVHLEIKPVSLRRKQFDYCRGVSVAIFGKNVGEYAFTSNRFSWHGYSRTELAYDFSSCANAVIRREQYFADAFRRPEPRFERLLLRRVKDEIDAIEAQLIAEGKPMQWVGYEDESLVRAGMEKGKAK